MKTRRLFSAARLSFPLAAALVALFAAQSAQAVSNSWAADADGNWATAGSWTGGVDIPGSTTTNNTEVATFNILLTADRAVTVDTTRYVGGITFGDANTSAFGYTLQTGTLQLNSGSVIQTTGAIGANTNTIASPIEISGTTTAAATFTSGATTPANGIISVTGTVTGSATAATTTTLTLNGTGTGANSIGGVIKNGTGGNLALVKSGAGIWTLSGLNTYGGGTTLSTGTLVTGNTGALGAAAAGLTLNGGTLRLATDTALSSKNVTLGGNTAITLDRATSGTGFPTTFGTLTSTSGDRTLTVAKGSNVTDASILDFTGTLSITGRTTTFDVGTGATVKLSGATAGGAQTITMIKSGGGSLIIAGSNPTWDAGGATQLNGGTLELRSLMGDTTAYRAAVTAAAGTTLRLVNDTATNFMSNFTANGSMDIVADRLNSAATSTTHTLGTLGIGAFTLGVSRGSNITGAGVGGITFGATTLSGHATFSPAANAALTVAAVSGTAFNLTKTGAGSMTVTGVLGTTSGTVTASDGLLTLSNTGNTFTGAVNVSGAGIISVPGNNGATGDPTYLGSGEKFINLTNGGTIRITSASNPTSASPKKFTFGTGGGKFDVNSGVTLVLDDNTGATAQLQGSGDLTKIGTGNLALGYSNQAAGGFSGFTGNIIVSTGSLIVGNANALGSSVTGTTTIASGATLSVPNNASNPLIVAENLTLSGTGVSALGAVQNAQTIPATFTGTVTLAADTSMSVSGTGGLSLNGNIGGGAFGITKIGNGRLSLGGANTYTGATTVNAGLLNVAGSLDPASAISIIPDVASGAGFSLGSGTANKISSTAALAYGSATGPTSLGFELGANTAGSDSINTTASATTTGTVNLNIVPLPGFGTTSTYDLITAASGLDDATYALTNVPGGYTYSLTTSDTLVTLNLTLAAAGDLYWRGNINNSWSALGGVNWFTSELGTANASANPGAGNTVNFSTVNATAPGNVITTTLDNNFTVNGLVFGSKPTSITSVTVAGGLTPAGFPGVLAIAPASSNDGIIVGSNAGTITISAPVLLSAAQTWSVNGTGANGSALTVSGALSGSGPVTINGLVTLSAAGGTSTHSGATTVTNGSILQAGVANSFSASTAVSVDSTGIVRLNGFNNTVASLTGTGTVQNNHASTGATLTVGDATNFAFGGTLQNGAGGALGLTKAGTGKLTLTGTNTHTGTTTVSEGSLVMGAATTLTSTNPVTLSGTGTLDINGFSVSTGAITSAVATSTITNSSTSITPSTATALHTPSGPGIYVDALTSASGGTIAALITDGPTRKTQVVFNNGNGNAQLSNDSNTFSGGLVLLDNPSGTRLNIGSAIGIGGNRYGTGPLVIGQAPTDKAGVYFNTAGNTFGLPIFVNTALGSDRFGIRNDGVAITLSGLITANADLVSSSNSAAASNTIITNKVTGAGGLVVDLSQTSTANTLHTLTLGTAPNANDYAGDTQIGRANVAPAQNYTAALALGAADQIPNGAGKGNVIITNNTGSRTGTLKLAGFSETINGLSGNGNVDGGSVTPTLTLGDNDATGNFSGNILNGSGTLSVTKIGTGTQTLSGASNFKGALTINGGLVAFPSSPASNGPLGESTVVNLNGGGISYTAAGANALNRTAAIGGSVGTVDVANAAGALTLTATSTGGDLVKTGPGSASLSGSTVLNASNGAGVVVSAGTLQAGFGGTDVATVTVGAAGNLNLADSTAETLTLENSVGALTLNGGAQLGFDLVGGSSDSIAVAAGGTAATSGTVILNFSGTPTATTYTLLTADSGLNGATYALGTAPNGFNYTINTFPDAVTVTVTAAAPAYWRDGQVNGLWSTLGSPANWTTDAAGSLDAASTPLANNVVIFSATGGTATSTVDTTFIVDSLQFANSHTINASGPGALTLTPASTSGGIRVLSGGLTAIISAPLTTTTGAAQTWDVDSTGSLTISGNTLFNGNVTKTNTGALTLSGNNSGSGAITLAGGTLNINSATALGSGAFTIGAGTTLNNSTAAAIELSTDNVQAWNGDFTFSGSKDLNLDAGAVTMNNNVAITTVAGTLTVGGIIGDGGNNRGLAKAGTGMLVLDGSNSYGGPTAINAGVLRITNGAGLGATTAGTTQSGASALELYSASGITIGAEPLTINGGGITDLGALRNRAGDNTYGGTVTMGVQSRINSDSGTLTLNNATAVTGSGLTLVVGGAGNTTISGAIATGTGGVSKGDAGILTLSGNNTYTGNTTVAAGTLNITGSWTGSAASSTLALGGTAGNTVTNVSGNITALGFTGGAVSGAVAVYNQTAGLASFTGNAATTTINVASATDSYGYLNLTGGTFKVANRFGIGGNGNTAIQATGITYVGGTGFLDLRNSEWALNYSHGHVTVAGSGVIDRSGAIQPYGIIMNSTVSGGQYGVLNVAGGSFLTTTQPIRFGNSTTAGAGNSNTALINLAAGTLQVGTAMTTSLPSAGANQGYVNFAGGTLKTSSAVANWIPTAPSGITLTSTLFGPINNGGSNDFVGGLTFNSNGFDSSLDVPLRGATGDGVAQGNFTVTGGSGYVGAPEVVFTGGTLAANGSPAAGYALISGGAVTGIVITAPGSYTAAPSVALKGGGGTGANVAVGTLVPNTSGGLTKSGLGTLTLSGANTYGGATIVSDGKLQLNGAAATGLLPTSSMTVEAAGTLGFTAGLASQLNLTGKDITLNGGTLAFDIGDAGVNDLITVDDFALTANSALNFTGIGAIGGTYTLVNANSITNTGSHTISGQTIGRVTFTPTINPTTITVTSSVYEGQWALTGPGVWSLGDPENTQGNWLNYKPTVSGDAALFGNSINGPSTVVVDTPHAVGYIRFDSNNAYTIGSNGSSFLALNNGTGDAVATVTAGSHVIAENVALLSHLDVIPATGTTLTVSGVVSGAKNLDLNGPGNLVLSGVNTYSGTTTVSNGALTLSGARTANMGVITVGDLLSTTGTLNISNGTFTTGEFKVGSGDNPLTAGIVNHTGGTLTMSGNQLLLGNGGTGTTSGSNSTGTYNLDGGTLNTIAGLGVLIGVNTGATGVFNLSSGTLNMAPTSLLGIARSDNSLATNTTGTFTQTGGTATVGILQMSGSVAANNAGGNSTLTLTGGTFAATTFSALCGGNNSTAAISIGGTAQVTLPAFPTNAKGTSATATITFDSDATGFLSPAAASATYMPAGTFTSAYLTANGAKFNVPTGRDITVAQVFADAVTPAAAGTLTKSGVGVLTLSGDNSYTGATIIDGGTLAITHANALGTTAGATTINGGNGNTAQTLSLSSATTGLALAEPINLYGNVAGRAQLVNNSAQNHTLTGPIDASSDTNLAQILSTGAGSISISGDISGTLSGGAFLFLRGTSTSALNRVTGSVNLVGGNLAKTDDGTWLIGAVGETYSWVDTAVAVGTLKMGVANVLPMTSVAIMGNSTGNSVPVLDLNGFDQTIAGIRYNDAGGSNGTRTITSATAAVLTVNNTSDFSPTALTPTVANSVRLTGSLELVKQGSGTLTLTGANTYTGATTVNGGTLLVNTGSLAAGSAVAVNGGTFGGTGTVGGNVTVAAVGNLAPGGGAAGTLTINGVLNISAQAVGSGKLAYGLGTLTGTNDKIVAGNLEIGSGSLGLNDFVFTNIGGLQAGTYTLITSTGGITGSLDLGNLTGVITPGYVGTLKINGSNLELDVKSAYSIWADGTFANAFTQKLPGDDPDGDTLTNQEEYAFGTDPTLATGDIAVSGATVTPGKPKIVADNGEYYLVFARRKDYVDAGLTYTVRFTADLALWGNNDDIANAPELMGATDGTVDAMRVKFPPSIHVANGDPKPNFANMAVTLVP